MSTFKNPVNAGRIKSVFAAGVPGYSYFEFDLSASYAAGAAADESLLLIGYVPVDCVLIPHLCLIDVPQLDSNGAPTGDYEIGTAADPDALKAAAAAETAVVLSGEDLRRDAGTIGSKTEDTPIYIRVSNVIATLGTGTIKSHLAYRAWDSGIDG